MKVNKYNEYNDRIIFKIIFNIKVTVLFDKFTDVSK